MIDDIRRIVCEAQIINRLFAKRGLRVCVPATKQRVPSHYLTPNTVVYDLSVPMDVTGDRIQAQQDDILSFIRQFRRANGITSADESGMEVMPTVRIDRYEHIVEVSRPRRDVLGWSAVEWQPAPMTALVGVRYSHAGAQPVLWNLTKPDQVHGLIAGTTGSGKTNTLLDVLYSLMLHNSPSDLAITVVDPKNSEDVRWLDDLPHVRSVARAPDDAIAAVQRFHAEMEQRERGIVPKTQRHVLAVEECASLTEHPDRQTRNRVLFALADIARRCRENNMNLIICTQKPTADVLGDQLKSNLAVRLVGSVTSKDDANTAVQVKASGAEALPGYGAFIYRLNRTMFRFQAPLVDTPFAICRRIKSRWGGARPIATTTTTTPPPEVAPMLTAEEQDAERIRGAWQAGKSQAELIRILTGDEAANTGGHNRRRLLAAIAILERQRTTTTTTTTTPPPVTRVRPFVLPGSSSSSGIPQ